MHFYSEHNRYRAAVLRERIADGSLPEGTVDERDIESIPDADFLCPAGGQRYSAVHLFAGIGGFPLGLRIAGIADDAFAGGGRCGILTGGFPCQDISNAGKRAGISGARSGLWREMVRAIRVVQPRIVLVENVAALLGRGMGVVLGDLAELRYCVEWDRLSAASVGAPHLRQRIFLVAFADAERRDRRANDEGADAAWRGRIEPRGEKMANADSSGYVRNHGEQSTERFQFRDDARSNTGTGGSSPRTISHADSGGQREIKRELCTRESDTDGRGKAVADATGARCNGSAESAEHADGPPLSAARSCDGGGKIPDAAELQFRSVASPGTDAARCAGAESVPGKSAILADATERGQPVRGESSGRGGFSPCGSETMANAEKRTIGAGLCASEPGNFGRRRSGDGGGEGNTESISHAVHAGLEGAEREELAGTRNGGSYADIARPDWWAVEPDVGRVAHGIPSRVDRLAALGDAIVPQCVAAIARRWLL